MRRDYFKLPSKITFLNLPASALAMYAFMASLQEDFNPSIRFLAKKLKMAPTTVIRNIELLESKNIIKKYENGSLKSPNKYEFINPKDWV